MPLCEEHKSIKAQSKEVELRLRVQDLEVTLSKSEALCRIGRV